MREVKGRMDDIRAPDAGRPDSARPVNAQTAKGIRATALFFQGALYIWFGRLFDIF
jgi:hypothetical protein